MSDKSRIEWTHASWNPVVGCSVVSPGCANCYAMGQAARIERMQERALDSVEARRRSPYAGLTQASKAGPVWNGKVALASDETLTAPLRWKRPRKIFVNSMGDLFHEAVPDAWIDQVFAVMALSPRHTFQVLTKRPKRMREWFEERWQPAPARRIQLGEASIDLPAEEHGETRRVQVERECEPFIQQFNLADTENNALWTAGDALKCMQWDWPLPNVWLGVSAERQAEADERIPDLLATPAAVRFVSCEPLLGPVDLARIELVKRVEGSPRGGVHLDALAGRYVESGMPYVGEWDVDGPYPEGRAPIRLDWIIVGGESGPNARPMHVAWVRAIRDQCAAAGTPLFFKQFGEWAPVCAMAEEAIDACYHPVPEGRPDATRREKVESIVLHADGQRFDGPNRYGLGAYQQGSGAMLMFKVGKRRAGSALDGVEHKEWPTARAKGREQTTAAPERSSDVVDMPGGEAIDLPAEFLAETERDAS